MGDFFFGGGRLENPAGPWWMIIPMTSLPASWTALWGELGSAEATDLYDYKFGKGQEPNCVCTFLYEFKNQGRGICTYDHGFHCLVTSQGLTGILGHTIYCNPSTVITHVRMQSFFVVSL